MKHVLEPQSSVESIITLTSTQFYKGQTKTSRNWLILYNFIHRGTWTKEEDLELLKFTKDQGKKWSEIAQILVNRTENSLKNRYHSILRKMNSKDDNIYKIDMEQEDNKQNDYFMDVKQQYMMIAKLIEKLEHSVQVEVNSNQKFEDLPIQKVQLDHTITLEDPQISNSKTQNHSEENLEILKIKSKGSDDSNIPNISTNEQIDVSNSIHKTLDKSHYLNPQNLEENQQNGEDIYAHNQNNHNKLQQNVQFTEKSFKIFHQRGIPKTLSFVEQMSMSFCLINWVSQQIYPLPPELEQIYLKKNIDVYQNNNHHHDNPFQSSHEFDKNDFLDTRLQQQQQQQPQLPLLKPNTVTPFYLPEGNSTFLNRNFSHCNHQQVNQMQRQSLEQRMLENRFSTDQPSIEPQISKIQYSGTLSHAPPHLLPPTSPPPPVPLNKSLFMTGRQYEYGNNFNNINSGNMGWREMQPIPTNEFYQQVPVDMYGRQYQILDQNQQFELYHPQVNYCPQPIPPTRQSAFNNINNNDFRRKVDQLDHLRQMQNLQQQNVDLLRQKIAHQEKELQTDFKIPTSNVKDPKIEFIQDGSLKIGDNKNEFKS